MGVKDILEFIKIEHALFSLPFIFIGTVLARHPPQFEMSILLWIIVAALGARGLAMALNRIIDRDIDASNPRTAGRHLASGSLSMQTAWILSAVFLGMLLLAAWQLNEVVLKMAWLPVLVFVIYPYTKRFTWLCHFWLGLCLGLAPAGAWLAIEAIETGWPALTGLHNGYTDFLWYPEIFLISLGVALWITAFDVNYARMDVENDRAQGIHSFPARFGHNATRNLSVMLTFAWLFCFFFAGIHEVSNIRHAKYPLWLPAIAIMALANLYVMTQGAEAAEVDEEAMGKFQKTLFRTSMATGWVLLISLSNKVYESDMMLD